MKSAFTRNHVVRAGIVVAALAGPASARAELGVPVGWSARWVEDEIPTKLVAPVDPLGFPDPICSRCKLGSRLQSASGGQAAQATISIDYVGEVDLVGDVRIWVHLRDGQRRLAAVTSVALVDQELWTRDVPAGFDWCWQDVVSVWIEVEPVHRPGIE